MTGETLKDAVILTRKLAEDTFDRCNEKYFDGKLRKIPVKVSARKNVRGYFKFDIDLDNRRLLPKYIMLSDMYDTTQDELTNTMVHEMLHYHVLCNLDWVSSKDWDGARSMLEKADRNNTSVSVTKLWRMLNLSDDKYHGGLWKSNADRLNEKFPGLDLSGVEKPEDLTYSDKYAEKLSRTVAAYESLADECHGLFLVSPGSSAELELRNTLGASNLRKVYMDWKKPICCTLEVSKRKINGYYDLEVVEKLEKDGVILCRAHCGQD